MTDTTTTAAAGDAPDPAPVLKPQPRWGTVDAALIEFRRRRDVVKLFDASALWRDGATRGWTVAVEIAEGIAAQTRISEVDAADRLLAAITENEPRIKATHAYRSPSPLLPEVRQGRDDAYNMAARIAARTVAVAKEHAAEEQARAAALARQPWEDEITDWDGYPLVPMPGDTPVDDLRTLALFLGGDSSSFTGDLLRLIAKADASNLQQLSAAFPRHVRAFLMWRACAPIPVRSLVAILNATTMINERKL